MASIEKLAHEPRPPGCVKLHGSENENSISLLKAAGKGHVIVARLNRLDANAHGAAVGLFSHTMTEHVAAFSTADAAGIGFGTR
jgi:hypothetical protein